MVELEFTEDGALVLIRFVKGLLALSRADFAAALIKGKRYQRRTKLETRIAEAGAHRLPRGRT